MFHNSFPDLISLKVLFTIATSFLAKFTIATYSTALAKYDDGSNCLTFLKKDIIHKFEKFLYISYVTQNNQVKYNLIERFENNNRLRTILRIKSFIPSTQQS
jgi:hypothetical protein